MSDLNEAFEEFNNTTDTTEQFEPADIEKNKVMAVFSYLSWLVLIPLLGAKDSRFARFHANQGLVLAIAEIVCVAVLRLLRYVPVIGWVFTIAGGLVSLVCFIFAIIGIVNAASGKAKELPIIGSFRILK